MSAKGAREGFQPTFLVLSVADALEILGEGCDPDNVRPTRPAKPGYFVAVWLKDGFKPEQLASMRENPRVFLHTGVFHPAAEYHADAVTFSILKEGSIPQKFIPGDLVNLTGGSQQDKYEVKCDNGHECRIKPLQKYRGDQPLNGDGTLTILTSLLQFSGK